MQFRDDKVGLQAKSGFKLGRGFIVTRVLRQDCSQFVVQVGSLGIQMTRSAEFGDRPPTAERVARLICVRASERLARVSAEASVAEVEVWETPTYRVIYRP